ncbi:MAG: hypothetical protein ACYSWU_28705, partial [Planctomycetota bacterium]
MSAATDSAVAHSEEMRGALRAQIDEMLRASQAAADQAHEIGAVFRDYTGQLDDAAAAAKENAVSIERSLVETSTHLHEVTKRTTELADAAVEDIESRGKVFADELEQAVNTQIVALAEASKRSAKFLDDITGGLTKKIAGVTDAM